MKRKREKRLPPGVIVMHRGDNVYRYAWRGGPRLHGEPNSPAFMEQYRRAIAQRDPDWRPRRVHPQAGETKGLITVEPWSGNNLRLSADRMEMTAEDDARLTELVVDRRLGLTQIAPLMGGKTYAVLLAAMERLGLVHDVPAPAAAHKSRPSLYGPWETPWRGARQQGPAPDGAERNP